MRPLRAHPIFVPPHPPRSGCNAASVHLISLVALRWTRDTGAGGAQEEVGMALMTTLWNDWRRWTCSHRWVRARWDDGTYGLRCALCMKPYRHTWDEIIGSTPTPHDRLRPAA